MRTDFSLLTAAGRAHGSPLMPRGNYPQSLQHFTLMDMIGGKGRGNALGPASILQTSSPLMFLLFGQDFVNMLWVHLLYEDITLTDNGQNTIVVPEPDHWVAGVTINSMAAHAAWLTTAVQYNYGRLEAFRGITVTESVPVVGYMMGAIITNRAYVDSEPAPAHCTVDGWFSCHAPIMVGEPQEAGAIAHGTEALVPGIYPVIIPEYAYTAACKANNNVMLDSNGVEIYVVGLWQGTT
jgi:hypothetical protein